MTIRRLKSDDYDSRGYSDENALAKLGVTEMSTISKKMTYTYGEEDATEFSFLAMAASRGGSRKVTGENGNKATVNDVQYKWATMGKMRHTVTVNSIINATNVKLGIGNTKFNIAMEDRWGIVDYGLLSPSGDYEVQISKITPMSSGKFDYQLELRAGIVTDYIPAGEFAAGKVWALTPPKVPESGSLGNEHRIMSPGEMTNQVSFSRYTHKIQGNVSNKVSVYEFSGNDTHNGSPTNLWINEEQRQVDIWMRRQLNNDIYIQKYNRAADGEIALKYYENDKPIPIGAGVRETIKTMGTYIPYGNNLPFSLLDNTLLTSRSNSERSSNKVVHGGLLFGRALNDMLVDKVKADKAYETLGGYRITNSKSGGLAYGGKPFTVYTTPEMDTITYVHDKMFDKKGLLGDLDIENGNLHSSGLPRSSGTGVVMSYANENIEYVSMEGQEWLTGIYRGITPIPASWKSADTSKDGTINLATTKDESSYEHKLSIGFNMKNAIDAVLFEMNE